MRRQRRKWRPENAENRCKSDEWKRSVWVKRDEWKRGLVWGQRRLVNYISEAEGGWNAEQKNVCCVCCLLSREEKLMPLSSWSLEESREKTFCAKMSTCMGRLRNCETNVTSHFFRFFITIGFGFCPKPIFNR